MTEESSGSFSAFWQKGVDKVSFKSVKFMPNTTKPGADKKSGSKTSAGDKDQDDGEGESSNLTQKQRRRAQVRKAQIEHRQRKENYVKHLEQDVINLREMIAQAETESVLFQHENEAIKSTLQKANVLAPPTSQFQTRAPPIPENPLPEGNFDFMDFATTLPTEPQQSDLSASISPPAQFYNWPTISSNSPEDMLISTSFDEWIDSTILQISPVHSHSSGNIPRREPDLDIYNFPNNFTNPHVTNPPPLNPPPHLNPPPISNINNLNQEALANLNLDASLDKPLPRLPDEGKDSTAQAPAAQAVTYPDLSTLAVNFILALEYPCRTHFHPPPASFDPKGKPTGHTLMASTLLYTSAPPSIYSTETNSPTENASWTAPSLELKQLYNMSKSLPKGDWEITPVQAWFLLTERYTVDELLGIGEGGKERGVGIGIGGRGGDGGVGQFGQGIGGRQEGVLERLKRGLGKLVDCFHFGAVMDEGRFWEVVEEELGVPKAKAAETGAGNEKGKEKEVQR
ncbi:uncharacterized protein PAC_09002 [Phialocephala subalpina]|uniref:BZIP domain-containing protein n=1 Tax=Phialocephala subalpina TaxID=576137 RepID=A0A1L7X263_9HELO|nr:uncharacterized protein PAC_09002 [Phialocephala subalpina]